MYAHASTYGDRVEMRCELRKVLTFLFFVWPFELRLGVCVCVSVCACRCGCLARSDASVCSQVVLESAQNKSDAEQYYISAKVLLVPEVGARFTCAVCDCY